ncbi:unnamed protein product [Rotaria magnacalcarata]
MCWQPNATADTIVAGGNGHGTTTSQLYEPLGLHLGSSSNNLYIGYYGAHNIVRWPLGVTNWTLIAGGITGTCGSTSAMLCYPTTVTIDSMGNLYVADTNNQRMQLFLADSTNGTTIAMTNFPSGVALDGQLNLYKKKEDICNLPPHTGPTILDYGFKILQANLQPYLIASKHWDFFAHSINNEVLVSNQPTLQELINGEHDKNTFNKDLLHISTAKKTHEKTHLTCRYKDQAQHINLDESDQLIMGWFHWCCPKEVINRENTEVLVLILKVARHASVKEHLNL